MTEKAIETRIRAALKKLGAKLYKLHGSQYSCIGAPDLIGALDGLPFAIEVKRPGGKLTARQRLELDEWARQGFAVGVAESVDDAVEIAGGKTDWCVSGAGARRAGLDVPEARRLLLGLIGECRDGSLRPSADDLREVANLLDPVGLHPDAYRLLLDTQPPEGEDDEPPGECYERPCTGCPDEVACAEPEPPGPIYVACQLLRALLSLVGADGLVALHDAGALNPHLTVEVRVELVAGAIRSADVAGRCDRACAGCPDELACFGPDGVARARAAAADLAASLGGEA